MRCIVAIAILTLAAGSSAQQVPIPFDSVPWIGYDVGSSAFEGNQTPFERDPTALATADLDGDGDQDVVVTNYEYAAPGGGTDGMSGFVVLFNEGDGVFSAPVHYTVSNKGCWDVAIGDFDEDGDPDLAVPVADSFLESGNTVLLYLNDGAGAFPTARPFAIGGAAPTGIAAGDFDGDGHLDLATANYQFLEQESSVSVLKGTGEGQFVSGGTYVVDASAYKLEAGDLNADGRPDLIVAHDWQQISVLQNDGAGGFGSPVAYDELFPMQGGMHYSTVALVDTDRDGDLDVLYSNTRSHPVGHGTPRIVHLLNNGGAFDRAPDILLTNFSSGPADLVAVDLNGDDWPDVAGVYFGGGTNDGLRVVMSDGAGGFGAATVIPAGKASFGLAAADVDGDGDPDLLTADRHSMGVTVHENPGDGAFPILAARYTSSANTVRLVAGDVDGDGDLDLFASGRAFGTPGAISRNNGDGTFADPVLYTHSTEYGRGASHAKLRDLDGDGDLDLLYNDAHTDFFTGYDFWVGLNDGTGTFGPLTEWDLGTCGNGDIDAVDLDNDGDLDVVNLEELGCAGSGAPRRIFIRLNNGDATFQPQYTVPLDPGPHALGHGDFDHDGDVDLVSTHYSPYGHGTYLNVHLGRGDGTFEERVVYPVGAGPRWIVVEDLNADGHLDLATANTGTDNEGRETMTVLFGVGDGTFTGRQDFYAPFSPDLLGATGIEAGDVDGDGDPDLMVATLANSLTMYYNDGAGGFTSPHRLGVYWGATSPVFEDFDGDGLSDVATLVSMPPSGIGREIAILRGIEGTTTSAPPPAAPTPGELAVTLAPNPVADRATVTVSTAVAGRLVVEVFDVLGRRVATVHEGPLAAGAHAFPIGSDALPPGTYVLRVSTTGRSATALLSVTR